MKTSEVNESLIGKRVSCVFTGMQTTGTIIGIVHDYDKWSPNRPLCSKGVRIKLDYPIQWGDDEYDEIETTSRVSDEYGSLSKTHLID
ncbi:DUF7258 domain-containing protein, partial [Hoylesella timonensis]|uniref:DUF7258 domain-containing protein n=1 Tax=Hoylesella timonensis CRIS 5C-B1 TaxID=679189 RepID=D1VXJ4_9BACT